VEGFAGANTVVHHVKKLTRKDGSMTLKYPEDFIGKIIQGDCLEVMRQMPDKCVDLVLTDPPYGLNNKIHDGGTWATHEKYNNVLAWDFKPTQKLFNEIQRIGKNSIIWGGNYFADMLPVSRCWLTWVKPPFPTMSEVDFAWTSFDKPAKVYHCPRVNPSIHPTQKPEKLINWCIENYSDNGSTIFDPFLGSGTTAVICEGTGRKWVGCEVAPKYCAIARKRIAAEQAQGKLF